MKPIVFPDAAREEMIQAAVYYERKSPGLGASPLNRVQLATDQVASFPEAGILVDERMRRPIVWRLPFGILCRVER